MHHTATILTVASSLALAHPLAASDDCATRVPESAVGIVRALAAAGAYDPVALLEGFDELTVPVALHVVRESTGEAGLTMAEILENLANLQAIFAPIGITLCPVPDIDFIDDTSFYSFIDSGAAIDELRATNVVEGAVNIYFTDELSISGLPLCGISSFTFSSTQGIVVRNQCTAAFGDTSTTAHEVGHYFDLFHTHETAMGVECTDLSNCEEAGDLLCDTAADPQLGQHNVSPECVYNGNEPIPCASTPTLYDPDPRNHMSYAPSECRDLFSPQQQARMRATLVNLRPELLEVECVKVDFAPPEGVSILSRDMDGFPGTAASWRATTSADGRFTVFGSKVNGLVPGDTNSVFDIFLHDREEDDLTRISVNAQGDQLVGESVNPIITPDARHLLFFSRAANILDPEGTQTTAHQAYVLDRETGLIERTSHDMDGGTVNNSCDVGAITPDGRFVLYVTEANDIVPNDTNNPFGRDVFRYDRVTGETIRANVSSEGAQAEGVTTWSWDSVAISDDGRYVAFTSYAENLVPDDTNGQADIFLRDCVQGTTTCLTRATSGGNSNGGSSHPRITGDGRFIFFASAASNLVPADANGIVRDVFVHDRVTGLTSIAALTPDGAQPNGGIFDLDVSPDGRFLAFSTLATNYAPVAGNGALEAIVHDRQTGRARVASPRGPFASNFGPTYPTLSADGTTVLYQSVAPNIVPNDLNGFSDIFRADGFVPGKGDVNNDGIVNFADLGALLGAWGACSPDPSVACPADVTGDGMVDFADLVTVLVNWS